MDKKGKIAFLGHPSFRRLDEDVQTLVKGRAIQGRGCVSLRDSKEEEWKEAGGEVQASEVDKAVK